jgi:hypothetical protein
MANRCHANVSVYGSGGTMAMVARRRDAAFLRGKMR